MDVLAHANLSLFPLVTIAIVYVDSLRMGDRDVESLLFRLVALAAFGTIVSEVLTWIPDGGSFPFAGPLLAASMVVYLLLAGSVCLFWLLYIVAKVRGATQAADLRRAMVACAVVYAPYAAIVATSPWSGLLFTIGEGNVYGRGVLYAVPYAFMAVIMALGAVLAVRRWLEEAHAEKRRAYLYLALFGVMPVVGLAVQQVWLEWWLAWPFVALSILLAYVNIQNVRGFADALTGLGNRAFFDRRLAEAWERGEADGPWGLIIVDVDDFKSVNDRFGHAFGDEVLCLVADDLRETFKGTEARLARFGGDEFVALAPCDGQGALSPWLDRLNAAMEDTAASLAPRPFSFSAGAARFDPSTQRRADDLVAAADRALYECKALHRGEAPADGGAAARAGGGSR